LLKAATKRNKARAKMVLLDGYRFPWTTNPVVVGFSLQTIQESGIYRLSALSVVKQKYPSAVRSFYKTR